MTLNIFRQMFLDWGLPVGFIAFLAIFTLLLIFKPEKPRGKDHRLIFQDGTWSGAMTKDEAFHRFQQDPSVSRVENAEGTTVLSSLSRGPLGKMPEHF